MKKILFILIFFMSSCGYQSIYLNKNVKNFEFSKISSGGEDNINKNIISSLSLKENEFDDTLNEISLDTYFKIEETSKDSRGRSKSFRSNISVFVTISKNNKVIKSKNFKEEFTYNNKSNKFDLVEYQDVVKNNLVNKIIEDIVLYINL